jgi:hypothetical protein
LRTYIIQVMKNLFLKICFHHMGQLVPLLVGGKGAKDANLPITVGPQKEAALGGALHVDSPL